MSEWVLTVVGEEDEAAVLDETTVRGLAVLGADLPVGPESDEDNDVFATLSFPDGTDPEFAAAVGRGFHAAIVRAVSDVNAEVAAEADIEEAQRTSEAQDSSDEK